MTAPIRRPSTRIVALRHASRVAARPDAAQSHPSDPARDPGRFRRDDGDGGHPGRRHRQRGDRRPVGRPARPDPAREPHLRPADRRLRPDRDGRARAFPARRTARRHVRRRPGAGPRRDRRRPRTARSGRTAGSMSRPSFRRRSRAPAGPASAGRRRSPSSWCAPGSCPATSTGAGRRQVPAQGQGAHPVDAPLARRSRARSARIGSSPPTSTRSSTATAPTASRPPRRSTSASVTWPISRLRRQPCWPACRSRRPRSIHIATPRPMPRAGSSSRPTHRRSSDATGSSRGWPTAAAGRRSARPSCKRPWPNRSSWPAIGR